VAEYASIWRATLVDKAASTLARNDTALRCHILPAWGDHRLDEVTSLQVQLWLAKLVTTPLSRSGAPMAPAGATRTLRIFSGMLQAAAQTDDTWLKANPARGVRAPKETTPERPFFTPDGLQRVADEIDPRYRALVLFAGYSGLRFAELTALQVRDINPLRGWVQIQRSLTEVAGRLVPGDTKSAAGRRRVGLPALIIEAIQPNLEGKSPTDLVFTAPHGGPLRRTLFASRFWRPALEKAGMPPAGLHSLRHTAATTALAAGASLRECADRLGHANPALTIRLYSHVAPETYEATTRRLDDVARRAAELRASS
jgi:integrase